MVDNQKNQQSENVETTVTESRRSFLKKAGAFAIYTPPAVTMLMHPSHASIMKSPGGYHPKKSKDKNGYSVKKEMNDNEIKNGKDEKVAQNNKDEKVVKNDNVDKTDKNNNNDKNSNKNAKNGR